MSFSCTEGSKSGGWQWAWLDSVTRGVPRGDGGLQSGLQGAASAQQGLITLELLTQTQFREAVAV